MTNIKGEIGESKDSILGRLRGSVSFQLGILYSLTMLAMMGYGIVMPTIPFFARTLGASALELGLFTTLFALTGFFVAPFWGTLSDRIGRRPVLLIGIVGYSASFLIMGLADSIWILLLGRTVGGLLSSSVFPTTQAYVADISDPTARSARMGVVGAMMNVGFVAGPAVGGLLSYLGPQLTFFVSSGVVLATALLILLLPRPEIEGRQTSMDTATTGAGAATHSEAVVRDAGLAKPQPALQPRRPRRVSLGAMYTALSGPLGLFFVLAFLMSFAGAAGSSMMPLFLMDKMGATERHISLVYTVMGATSALLQGLAVGPATAALGRRRAALVALTLTAAGYLLALLVPSIPLYIGVAMLMSAGMSLLRPIILASVSVGTKLGQGLTMGVMSSFDSLGRGMGPLWAGLIYDFSINGPFLTVVGIGTIGIVLVQTSMGRQAFTAGQDNHPSEVAST